MRKHNFIDKLSKQSKALFVCLSLVLCPALANADEGDKFALVKNVSELKDGDIVIIAKKANSAVDFSSAFGTDIKNSSDAVLIDIDENNVATITDGVQLMQLEQDEGNKFYIKLVDKNKYISNNNTSNYKTSNTNNIKLVDEVNTSSSPEKATITIVSDTYDAQIWYAKQGKGSEKYLSYYYDNSPNNKGWYSLYNKDTWGPAKSVQLYKRVPVNVTLNEASDNASVIKANNDKTVNASLTRTLVAEKWNTFCVPFDISLKDGKLNGVEASVMEYNSVDGDIMFFAPASEIKAGKAYLIKPSKDIKDPTFLNVKFSSTEPGAPEVETYSFTGLYSPKTFTKEEANTSLFVNGNAKFNKPKANSTMNGMRAYFTIPSNVSSTAQLQISGIQTSINEVTDDVQVGNSNIYSINGQYVGKDASVLEKGIYIRNGKKLVIK